MVDLPPTPQPPQFDALLGQFRSSITKSQANIKDGLTFGLIVCVAAVVIYEAAYVLSRIGVYWANPTPPDEQFVDIWKTLAEGLIYLALIWGLLGRQAWAWWVGVIFLGLPYLPIDFPKTQYDTLPLLYNYQLRALTVLPLVFFGEPARILSFIYLISHKQRFSN